MHSNFFSQNNSQNSKVFLFIQYCMKIKLIVPFNRKLNVPFETSLYIKIDWILHKYPYFK